MHPELSSVAQDLRRFFADSLTSPACPSDTADDRFEALALRVFRIQHALNAPYRALCDARGVAAEDVTCWSKIPAVSTAAFKEFAFSCLQKSERTTCFESSGTTNKPRSRNHHSDESLELYHVSLLPWFQRHVLPETVDECDDTRRRWNFISLTPPPSQAPHSSLIHMLATVSSECWFKWVQFVGQPDTSGGWALDVRACLAVIERSCVEQRPVTLAGTAFNFVHLLDALDTQTLRLPVGSRVMETGGYKGRSQELSRDELHVAIATKLGVRRDHIITEYGMTELGSQAYDQVADHPSPERTLKFPPWARAVVISSETGCELAEGESGLLHLFDLANAFSVVAVETEDMAVRRATGIELLGRQPQAEPRGCSLMAV